MVGIRQASFPSYQKSHCNRISSLSCESSRCPCFRKKQPHGCTSGYNNNSISASVSFSISESNSNSYSDSFSISVSTMLPGTGNIVPTMLLDAGNIVPTLLLDAGNIVPTLLLDAGNIVPTLLLAAFRTRLCKKCMWIFEHHFLRKLVLI